MLDTLKIAANVISFFIEFHPFSTHAQRQLLYAHLWRTR